MKRLIHQNKEAGIKQYFHMDDEGNATLETTQDVAAIIDENKNAYNQVDARSKWGDMNRVASIPLSVFYTPKFQELLKLNKAGNDKPLRAWLNDPENIYFRTRGGRV